MRDVELVITNGGPGTRGIGDAYLTVGQAGRGRVVRCGTWARKQPNGVGRGGHGAERLLTTPADGDGHPTPGCGPRETVNGSWLLGTTVLLHGILSESLTTAKRELVASRFTLQGLLRRHAGKSGPFLLHGGQAPTRCKPDRGCLFPGTAAGGCAVAKCEWWLRRWASL